MRVISEGLDECGSEWVSFADVEGADGVGGLTTPGGVTASKSWGLEVDVIDPYWLIVPSSMFQR